MSSLDVEVGVASSTGSEKEPSRGEIKLVRKPRRKQPPARVQPPTALQRIFGNKNVVKDHYFSAGAKVTEKNQRDILTEPSPFKYPEDRDEFSYKVMSKVWRENLTRSEMKLKYNVRNNYRSRQQLDVLNRLYSKEAPVKSMRTIFDIDPTFFTIVEGRQIGQKLDIREYVNHMRTSLRTKIVTGYRQDDILLFEESYIEEQRMIDTIRKEYQTYVDTFEEFLYNDHTASMALLRQSEQEATIAAEKYETFRELSKDYGALKSSVYNLEEKWRNCKMYQKFLYLVSPMHWRKAHDYYHIKKESSHQSIIADVSSVFGRYRLASTGDIQSLENLLEQFLDDCRTQEDPLIFFNDPQQLIKVFRYMEIQNLNSLLHSEEMAVPILHVNEGMLQAQKKFAEELNCLQEIIDNLGGEILWEEERAQALEELATELINGDYRKLVSNSDVLNLYVFVEDVYEARVAPNDANLDVCEMMKAIETKYLAHLLELDYLPQDAVYKAESECYSEEARIMKIAELAAKKVVQIDQLIHRLYRSLQPPPIKTRKDLKWRSRPFDPVVVSVPPTRPLTAEETEQILFFTQKCEGEETEEDIQQ